MKNSIKIEVQVNFIKEQSSAAINQHTFAYTITMTNNGLIGAQLLTRRWRIQDETGHTEDVIGEGVVGQQPHLMPGESYQYSSGSVIKTATGTMKGAYGMVNDEGERFEAEIPEFILSEPYTLH
ncbi:Co2+/Mg2+ efflux protein ApaG [Candidatus Thioglobus sp.]|jgi:ApaG protein|uniref:Co2+/Mg2+ efflux protein ApaG n=1 Tax=Candidatus Thioglobus sp. TaxID=2026721 RepID=UPI001D60B418|nr:Co2+/Mg2+ efflux protein ApaG [Candidatus Thioglobus sp.]MBT3276552.1 Co2+/Mg2+ efflux protein ApaG [Candidatus Thioglobus sp.]MBT3447330.1 Co2+/Mg2+ efflux protein ApaG [Candidatus Thioglobus sp.]MBT3744870.1 Co2+/Mg2+ efflux protein ApaG [Candidatus Thioglobus sp.]MBT4000791.1 Co2+/Mg2+ efflux protein ApaG [Candidatus Thioglobus sp.]MBT4182109.1 Co2+/Mg2+ efflux protein ApaG [Candidatus Thioglobus sp.]